MTVNKRKKNTRQRGSHTHGWGAKKKHRGSGHRGGVGRAGSGKRADQKKPSILKEFGSRYFGKYGFNRPKSIVKKFKCINVGALCAMNLKKEGEYFVADKSIGFNKILGSGKVDCKLKVRGLSISKKAAEKINSAGGVVENESE